MDRPMTDPSSPRPRWAVAVALAAMAFGIVTVAVGGNTLFGGAQAGDIVPFVLWFNFLAGFAYVAAGVGLWRWRRWAALVAAAIAAGTLAVFAAFGLHVLAGGAFETRTVGAMTLRSLVWVAIAVAACRALGLAKPGPRA